MSWETWTLYVATVIALMSTPGPSQLLMLSNSMTNGFARALATACGDLSANLLQMFAAGLGLAVLLVASEHALTIIKWAGVLYLGWRGLRLIMTAAPGAALSSGRSRTSLKTLWLQGFITSAANPKAIIFFAALFPQFLSLDLAFWPQFAILSVTYLTIDGLFLSVYGITSGWLGARLKGPARAWADRIGGGFMLGAAILLGLKTIRPSP